MTGDGLDFGGAMARIWGSSLTGERGEGGLYRPLMLTIFHFERKIWGLNPAGYHLVNILLNTLCTVLLYFIAKIFLKKPIYAFLTALLFLFHPAHPATVHWISARGDLLCTAGYLGGILFSLRYLLGGDRLKIILAGIFFLVAYFSKEMAITAPVVAVLAAVSVPVEARRGSVRWVFAVSGIMAVVFLMVRVAFLGMSAAGGGDYYLAFGRFFAVNAAKAFGFLFIPFGHEGAEQFMFANRGIFLAIGVVFILVSLGIAFFVLRKNRTALILSLGVVVSILPVMGMAMRWHMYLPSALMALTAGVLLFKKPPKAFSVGIYGLVLILFTIGFAILRSHIARSSDFARELIKRGTEVLAANPEAEGFVFMLLPSKIHRNSTYTNGYVPTLQAVSGDKRPMVELLPSVHYGDYRSCEFEFEGSRLEITLDSAQDYIAPRVRDYLIGKRGFSAGEKIHTQDGLELEIVQINEIGRVSSVKLDLAQEIFPSGARFFIFQGGDWREFSTNSGAEDDFGIESK